VDAAVERVQLVHPQLQQGAQFAHKRLYYTEPRTLTGTVYWQRDRCMVECVILCSL